MQTTLESTGAHTVKLSIEVQPDEFGKDLDRAYTRIAEQVRIPGFRKGKAPRKVIDAQVGREAVLEEFIEIAIPAYYRNALREHDLAPIGDPDISLDAVDIAAPLRFSAEVEVRPRLAFSKEEYRGLAVTRPAAIVEEADVDATIERLRDRFAELESVQRPLADGDYAVVDLRATDGDAEVADLSRPDAMYEVGSATFVEGLDRELRGKKVGDIVRFTETLDPRAGDLVFRPGPVFTHLLLADEINRTPPKTQSALLEAMEEGQVSVDGVSHRLPDPYLVAATQNPLEYEGTYPLPEAQLDRFLMRIPMGYPSRDAEVATQLLHALGVRLHLGIGRIVKGRRALYGEEGIRHGLADSELQRRSRADAARRRWRFAKDKHTDGPS